MINQSFSNMVPLFGLQLLGKARDVQVGRCSSRVMVYGALRQWHDIPSVPAGWRVAFAFYLRDSLIGVATWGRPVARLEDAEHTLELTRHALAPGCPKNTATWTLAKMRRYIREQMPAFTRLISYCDMQLHLGTMYKADNWLNVGVSERRGAGWRNRAGRLGTERAIKTKWERMP